VNEDGLVRGYELQVKIKKLKRISEYLLKNVGNLSLATRTVSIAIDMLNDVEIEPSKEILDIVIEELKLSITIELEKLEIEFENL